MQSQYQGAQWHWHCNMDTCPTHKEADNFQQTLNFVAPQVQSHRSQHPSQAGPSRPAARWQRSAPSPVSLLSGALGGQSSGSATFSRCSGLVGFPLQKNSSPGDCRRAATSTENQGVLQALRRSSASSNKEPNQCSFNIHQLSTSPPSRGSQKCERHISSAEQ